MEDIFKQSKEIEGDVEREGISERLDTLIKLAIEEDLPDYTAGSIFIHNEMCHGRVMAKEQGILCGICCVARVFAAIDPKVKVILRMRDGCSVVPGDIVADVIGPTSSVLAGERTALNFVQRMSGVATSSSRFADTATSKGMTCRVLDTRKTLPGWRLLDKYAVRVGGTKNHRKALFDMAMVKDNHADAAGGINRAVELVRISHPQLPIEVEVRNEKELREALSIRPPLERIMLDNMSNLAMRNAVNIRNSLAPPRIPLEASGGVSLSTICGIAETGVDFVSVGATTHSVIALDFNMKVVSIPQPYPTTDSEYWKLIDSRRAAEELSIITAKKLIEQQNQSIILLSHISQRSEVVSISDKKGGTASMISFASKLNSNSSNHFKYIVCCSPIPTAELFSAFCPNDTTILCPADRNLQLPPPCTVEEVDLALKTIGNIIKNQNNVIPIVVCGSWGGGVELAAWAGKNGGIACTASTAALAIKTALELHGDGNKKIFFIPDINLCESAAATCDIPFDKIVRWSTISPIPDENAIKSAKIIAWAGANVILQRFDLNDINNARKTIPTCRILVHSRCPRDVRVASDMVGTTSQIVETVLSSPSGSVFAIGDERRAVENLAKEVSMKGKAVFSLGPICRAGQCPQSSSVTLASIAHCISSAISNSPTNVSAYKVTIPEETKTLVRKAFERVLLP